MLCPQDTHLLGCFLFTLGGIHSGGTKVDDATKQGAYFLQGRDVCCVAVWIGWITWRRDDIDGKIDGDMLLSYPQVVSRIPIGQEPPSTDPGKSRILPLSPASTLCITSVNNSRILSSYRV